MMSQEQAAKYFIVAWVKDWSLRTYWRVITETTDTPWDQARSLYPWMPDAGWFMANGCVRRFLAEAHRTLNDAMWDAKDDKARLGLAPKIQAFQAGQVRARRIAAAADHREAMKENRRSRISIAIALESRDRGAGHHWNVCK